MFANINTGGVSCFDSFENDKSESKTAQHYGVCPLIVSYRSDEIDV